VCHEKAPILVIRRQFFMAYQVLPAWAAMSISIRHAAKLTGVALWLSLVPNITRAQPVILDGGWQDCSADADADCGDPYLACVATQGWRCADSDAGSGCPQDVSVTLHLCSPTYQQPCRKDSDCGPDGFTCNLDAGKVCSPDGCETISRCESGDYTLCSSDAECPDGWSCYAPPDSCLDCDDAGFPQVCYPPFTVFHGGNIGGTRESKAHGANADAGSLDAGASVSRARARSPVGPSGGCAVAQEQGNSGAAWLLGLLFALRTSCRRR
jgi:hypothetical protein